jgi:hypothetical protein
MLIALGMSIAAVDGALWRARPARSVKAVRLHPSRVVADAFMEVLCRQPTDSETIDWDTRPVDPASLVTTLSATPEARRVREIRALYFERLRRQPAGADCPQIHDWSARGVDVDRMTRALDASAEGQRVAHVSAAIAEVTGWDPRGWDEARVASACCGSLFRVVSAVARRLAQRPHHRALRFAAPHDRSIRLR